MVWKPVGNLIFLVAYSAELNFPASSVIWTPHRSFECHNFRGKVVGSTTFFIVTRQRLAGTGQVPHVQRIPDCNCSVILMCFVRNVAVCTYMHVDRTWVLYTYIYILLQSVGSLRIFPFLSFTLKSSNGLIVLLVLQASMGGSDHLPVGDRSTRSLRYPVKNTSKLCSQSPLLAHYKLFLFNLQCTYVRIKSCM